MSIKLILGTSQLFFICWFAFCVRFVSGALSWESSLFAGSSARTADGTGTAALFQFPTGITVDSSGNLYVADTNNQRIRKITPAGAVTTLAGSTPGYVDGTGTAAQFLYPPGITVDSSGNLYVADSANHRIRRITPAGVVTTFAGSGTAGSADGAGTAAQFTSPNGITIDLSGNLYVAELYGVKIRKITPAGAVTTFAGSSSGYADGTGTAAQFYYPEGITVDSSGNLYVADTTNHRIRKITPAGAVTTFAGSSSGTADGTGTAAQFTYPRGITIDSSGNLYVADSANHRIRKITPVGVVTTFAGSSQGYLDGTGTAAQFYMPKGITADSSGNIYVADTNNHRIRKITPVGVVTTLAGSTLAVRFLDGTGTAARFNAAQGITEDASGNLYVADTNNQRIRKITPAGVVTTLAGDGSAVYLDGNGTAASFYQPYGITIDSSGNLYVGDSGNHRIRKITPAGVVTTLAGDGTAAYLDGSGTAAKFMLPSGITADSSGNLYVADSYNNKIRKITPAGVVTTFAGSSSGTADGIGTAAKFSRPYGITVDSSGNLYVTDWNTHRIRKITPAGAVTTLAGSIQGGSSNGYADGTGTTAQFYYPQGITADSSGNLYVADSNNHRIRKITPAGLVTTLSTGIGTAAEIQYPRSITIVSSGHLFIGQDYGIVKMSPYCDAGEFLSTGSTTCEICSAGQYSSVGSSSCLSCPIGQDSEPGSSECTTSEATTTAIPNDVMNHDIPVYSFMNLIFMILI